MGGRLLMQRTRRGLVPGLPEVAAANREFEMVGRPVAGRLLRRRRTPDPLGRHPLPRESSFFLKRLSGAPLPPRAPRESLGAVREPSRGFTRLMSTGIVGSNPCGVIRDISSAAAGDLLRSRPSSFVLSFPPPAPLRRRFLAARWW